jgi:hypothetical protein
MNGLHKWILLILFGWFIQTANAQQTKHGLIIAIGEYPKETDWKPISSVNDIPLIKNALVKQGFNDIDSIKNEQATKAGIIKAFEALNARVKKGDIVVIHISSHGQQIDDNNGDELDGYDEAIVAYGAPMYSDDGYMGENHLRDEELGELLDNIRVSIGPTGDLMVFLDACHSGTGTRGDEKARGGAEPIHVNNSMKRIRQGEEPNSLFESNSQSRGGNEPMAPMVVFSGASAEERNFEYKGFGSLSVAISRSFEQLNSTMSYRAFWANVMKEMSIIAPNQNPVAEGDIDRELFGGRVLQMPKFYTLSSLSGNYATLQGGKINGLFQGTEIAIFSAGTTDIKGKTPVATGTINYCEYNFASASLNKPLEGNLSGYWAFVTKQTFGDIRMSLSLNINNKTLSQSLTTALNEHGLVNWQKDKADFELRETSDGLQLIRRSDASIVIDRIPTTDSFNFLKGRIEKQLQGKFIKDLELRDPSIHVELILEPVLVLNRRIIDTLPKANYLKDGIYHFKDGDQVRLRLVNKGTKDAYITIVDIEPSGKINVLVPNPKKNEDPKNFIIPKDSSKVLEGKYVTIRKPAGTETFKLIASHEPMNLGPIIDSGGSEGSRSASGIEGQLETIFRNSYKASTRSGDMGELLPDTEANTTSVVFKIKE